MLFELIASRKLHGNGKGGNTAVTAVKRGHVDKVVVEFGFYDSILENGVL